MSASAGVQEVSRRQSPVHGGAKRKRTVDGPASARRRARDLGPSNNNGSGVAEGAGEVVEFPRGTSLFTSADSVSFTLDGSKYITQFFRQARPKVDRLVSIVTVLDVKASSPTKRATLERCVQSLLGQDDVFNTGFLKTLVVKCSEEDAYLDQDTEPLLKTWGTTSVRLTATKTRLPSGPYYHDHRGFHRVYKVQDDFNKAFLTSTIQPEVSPVRWGDAQVSGSSFSCLGVPIPSRLYFAKTPERPLNGTRIAVKDCFHMAGLRTSMCSRAYHDFYPEQENTAVCLQRLVQKGAQLVGKTHLSSFAWREEPTDCSDYQAPFNPRGDGYQSPAGSSSGSGAAIASYDWLDFAIGTDTTGSGRRPGLWNGAFALRPSAQLLSNEGVVPTCSKFDVPSFLGRDLTKFKSLMSAWCERELSPACSAATPWKVLWPTDYMAISNVKQLELVERFATDLCKYLNTDLQRFSIKELWKKTSPVEETSFDRYLDFVQEHGFFYDAYHNFDGFRGEHIEKLGRPPYLSPPTQWMWDIGALVSKAQRDEAMHRFEIVRKWMQEHVLAVSKQRSLMILPIESLEPRYRDTAHATSPTLPRSLSVLYLSPVAGSPELVIPVGHVPYYSRITQREEKLPAAVALMAAPDMDIELIDVVEAFLKDFERPTSVSTGQLMW